jgi:hypothetical protein
VEMADTLTLATILVASPMAIAAHGGKANPLRCKSGPRKAPSRAC